MIKRNQYVDKLLSKSWNGKVKIITGIRRCGKSFLLNTLYKQALMARGVKADCFIEIDLERGDQVAYRNPVVLADYVKEHTKDRRRKFYVFIDEIQRSYKVKTAQVDESLVPEEDRDLLYTTFYDTLSSLMALPNVDVYVTGSNSKMLSTDIVTNFRDRGSEIKVYPLSLSEFYGFAGLEKTDALEQYLQYGGMPLCVLERERSEKQKYLQDLHKNVYMKDIVERHKLKDDTILDALTDAIYSAVGSLSNPHKLAMTTGSLMGIRTSDSTIKGYLGYLEDAYLISGAKRWDVKGKRYFSSIQKYYAKDLGLRNARLNWRANERSATSSLDCNPECSRQSSIDNWRQQERSHLMENLLFNELTLRGYAVDVGVVELERVVDGKRSQSQYEIDFVVNTSVGKVYIQSALNIDTPEKKAQETFSLRNTGDFYRKIVVLDGCSLPWADEDGVIYTGIIPFLLGGVMEELVEERK